MLPLQVAAASGGSYLDERLASLQLCPLTLKFPRIRLVGNPVNRDRGAAPLLLDLHETSELITMPFYKTSYG